MARVEHPPRRPAVVTGGSSGIGAATARALAARGLPVALAARRHDRCDAVAAEITAAGGEAYAFELDLTDPDSVKRFAAAVTDRLGEVEVVVSNAGLVQPGLVHETDTEQFARELNLNVLGAHRLVSAFVPGMVERRRGDVLFVSSDVAGRARPRMSAYSAGKRGLEGMAEAMQMELEGTGVRVSLVRPGPTLTEMGMSWPAEQVTEVIEAWTRWGLARHSRFLKPEAVAEAVATVVTAPRGTHITMLEVQPEAPLEERS